LEKKTFYLNFFFFERRKRKTWSKVLLVGREAIGTVNKKFF